MNKKRQRIYDKSGGHCWYCGCLLPAKGWHADHFVPLHRDWNTDGSARRPEMDKEENLVPACAPCNLFKATYDIEGFRREIEMQVERASKRSVNFRTALRFGVIELKTSPVVFWFEKQGF